MKPALDVLYSLAFVQGVVYGYRASYSSAKEKLADHIVEEYKFDHLASASVWEYMEDTMSGCEKDPTFARGRNLITYAVDLMESNSPDSFLSGVRILDTILSQMRKCKDEWSRHMVIKHMLWSRHVMIKHMIGSSSSSPVLQKLLQARGTRSPCNRETRVRAARIVKHLAGDIHLEKFPRGTEDICSLIGTFEEYSLIEPYQREWLVEETGHKWHPYALRLSEGQGNYGGDLWDKYVYLFFQGMHILGKLATDESNVRAISDNQGLLSRIMAPVTSDLLHNVDHSWSSVVQVSMEVMSLLVSAPGETGAKMRRDISGNSEAISAMNRILNCEKGCSSKIWELSVRILTRLYMDTQVTQDFINLLVHEFDNVDMFNVRVVASEALAMLSSTGPSNVMIILQADDDVVSNLIKILLYVDTWSSRILAAKILEHLCIHCTMDDKCRDKLKEAMSDLMPKLLIEVLPEEATETGTGAGFSSSQADIERQQGGASQANDLNKSAPASESERISDLCVAFFSLFVMVWETLISADPDKASQFSGIHESSLPRKLRALAKRIIEPTANDLSMLKLTCRMVISMVKSEGRSSYCKHDLESLMEALSIASKNMVPVDGSISMYSASGDNEADRAKPFRSLASLVKEAKEIVFKYCKGEESQIMELSTSANGVL